MRRIVTLGDLRPQISQLFHGQGRTGKNVAAMESAAGKALDILQEKAKPEALIQDISKEEFREVFTGEGCNEVPNPMEAIFPAATGLSLFAFTLGNLVSHEIDRLFSEKDFLAGYFLDMVASLASEAAVREMEASYKEALKKQGHDEVSVLSYSPGYCGWHISGQKRLFTSLHPEEIGIHLTEGCLMDPLKSVTGVLVAAEPGVHRFRAKFPFCRQCRDHTCRERQSKIGIRSKW